MLFRSTKAFGRGLRTVSASKVKCGVARVESTLAPVSCGMTPAPPRLFHVRRTAHATSANGIMHKLRKSLGKVKLDVGTTGGDLRCRSLAHPDERAMNGGDAHHRGVRSRTPGELALCRTNTSMHGEP